MHGVLKKIVQIFISTTSLGLCSAQVGLLIPNLPAPTLSLPNLPAPLILAALPQPKSSAASTSSVSTNANSSVFHEPSAAISPETAQVMAANNAAVNQPLLVLSQDAGASARYSAVNANTLPGDLRQPMQQLAADPLPAPLGTPRKPLSLSLNEAVLLTLRTDPNVINAELTRVTDKFALLTAHWQYWEPQYTLAGTTTLNRGGATTYGVAGVGATVDTPIGTQVTAAYTQSNVFGGSSGGGTTFTVTQPLLKGFGWAVNTTPWYNALDTEENAKLAYKNTVISEIVTTIQNYRGLVQSYNSLNISTVQLKSTKQTLDQMTLQLKEGQLSKSDYIQQKSNYEQQLLTYVQAQQGIDTAYYAFLQGLGLDPTAKVVIDKTVEVTDVGIPPMKKAIELALKGNIAYQTALINLRATQRNVIVQKNNQLWTLGLTYTSQIGNNSSATATGGSSTVLTWSVPIHNMTLQQGLVNAKVALEQAQITLAQSKRQTINTTMTDIINLKTQYEAILLAKEQVRLQQLTVNNTRLKLKYGKTTVFELNTEQQSLISNQNNLLSAEITFQNDLTTLYSFLGLTLDRWRIKLRY